MPGDRTWYFLWIGCSCASTLLARKMVVIASNKVVFITNFGWVGEEEYLGTWYGYMNIWDMYLYDDAEDKRRAGGTNKEE